MDTNLWRRAVVAVDQLIAPLVVFAAAYFATLFLLVPHVRLFQWVALVAAAIATAATIFLWDRGRWRLGFFVPSIFALRETALGLAVAILLIGSADVLIVLTTGMRHSFRGGFPWVEVAAVFVPAVFHEELLFRGYPFQRLWRWKPPIAIFTVSAVFAALHAGNASVTALGLLNVFLGGILLSLAWIRYERLWFPIGIHLGWNLVAGPLLGYEVSGYVPAASFLSIDGAGHPLLTGGAFGIEGSIWMTAAEIVAIIVMLFRMKKFE